MTEESCTEKKKAASGPRCHKGDDDPWRAWCRHLVWDSRDLEWLTADEYVDFHLRIENDMRRENREG